MKDRGFVFGSQALEDMRQNPDKIYAYSGGWYRLKDNKLWCVTAPLVSNSSKGIWKVSVLSIEYLLKEQLWYPLELNHYDTANNMYFHKG